MSTFSVSENPTGEKAGRRSPAAPIRVTTAARVRLLLQHVGTNLHRVSEITRRAPYGEHTSFAIPHWFYSDLERGGTPHISQVVALSEITGVSLVDWLAVFGHRLDAIPRLQVSLPNERPILLNTAVYDRNVDVQWFDLQEPSSALWEQTAPLSDLIVTRPRAPLGSLIRNGDDTYSYLKTSALDGWLYPHVGAGSIVRVDSSRTALGVTGSAPPVFAVQWRGGLMLTFVKPASGKSGFVVMPPRYPTLEQVIGRDLTILGAADWEFRPLADRPLPKNNCRRSPVPHASEKAATHSKLGAVLRRARERAGLNYRAAHELTVRVSELTGDPSHAVSQSGLFNYELSDTIPRHISKIVSLCVVYGLSLWEFLDAAGLHVGRTLGSAVLVSPGASSLLGGIPVFLREAIPALIEHDGLSFDDVYVCGRRLRGLNPLFQGALLLTVNRRQRAVERINAQAQFRRPMFLVREPSGQLVTGVCSVDRGVLTLQPRLQAPTALARYAARDAEVIGRVSGVLRLLDPGASPGYVC